MSLITRIQALATRISTEIKTVKTIIAGNNTGALTSLTTTNKNSLVGAINEVNGKTSAFDDFGGRNYVLNSGNFTSADWWAPYSQATITLENRLLKVIGGSTGAPRLLNGSIKSMIIYEKKRVNFTLSVVYKNASAQLISVTGKSSDTTTSLNESGAQSIGTITKISSTELDDGWIKDVFNIYTLAETPTIKAGWFMIGIPQNSTFYFRSFKLEKGSNATDWTPAPEDQMSDWNITDATSFSFIKNKPTQLSQFIDNIGVGSHIVNKANPHEVTKAQVGLGNVDNTSDLNKPISNAQASANGLKVDKLGGGKLNIDNDIDTGFYYVYNYTTGVPSGIPSGLTILQHIQIEPIYTASQTLFSRDNTVYTRVKINGIWQQWIKLASNTTLANYVNKAGDTMTGNLGIPNATASNHALPFGQAQNLLALKADLNDSRIVEVSAKKITAISVTGDSNKTITLTRQDGTVLTATFLDKDTEYPDDVINTLTFNTNNGVLIAITSEGEVISVSLDGRYSLLGHIHTIAQVNGLQSILDGKEPTFSKNTAFNKNFGTTSGTVAEGNDSRINNGQTAFGWGNHAGLYSLLNHTHAVSQIIGLEGMLNDRATLSDLNAKVDKAGDIMDGSLEVVDYLRINSGGNAKVIITTIDQATESTETYPIIYSYDDLLEVFTNGKLRFTFGDKNHSLVALKVPDAISPNDAVNLGQAESLIANSSTSNTTINVSTLTYSILTPTDNTYIFGSHVGGLQLTLPDPTLHKGKKITATAVNSATNTLQATGLIRYKNLNSTGVGGLFSITVISNGQRWVVIAEIT